MTTTAFRRCLLAWILSLLATAAFAQSYDDGMRAYDGGNYAKALEIWGPLAEAGDPIAQYSLGKLLEKGGGRVVRDFEQAAKWYERSANQGVTSAQNNLGLMYAQGRGVPRDPALAAEYWQLAADNDHAIAQFNLGLAYFRGEGVEKDQQEAERLFRRAGKLGLADAQYALGQVARMGLTAEADEAEALRWYEMAAAQGHAKAQTQAEALRRAGVTAKLPGQPSSKVVEAPEPTQATPPKPQPKPESPPAMQAKQQETEAETTAPLDTANGASEPPQPPQPAAGAEQQSAADAGQQAPVVEAAKEPAAEPASESTPESTAEVAAEPVPVMRTQVAAIAADTTAPAAAGYSVWLISLKDSGEASSYLDRIRAEHPELFAVARGEIAAADIGKAGTVHRVLASGLPSWDAATSLCRDLRAKEPAAFCKVLGN